MREWPGISSILVNPAHNNNLVFKHQRDWDIPPDMEEAEEEALRLGLYFSLENPLDALL